MAVIWVAAILGSIWLVLWGLADQLALMGDRPTLEDDYRTGLKMAAAAMVMGAASGIHWLLRRSRPSALGSVLLLLGMVLAVTEMTQHHRQLDHNAAFTAYAPDFIAEPPLPEEASVLRTKVQGPSYETRGRSTGRAQIFLNPFGDDQSMVEQIDRLALDQGATRAGSYCDGRRSQWVWTTANGMTLLLRIDDFGSNPGEGLLLLQGRRAWGVDSDSAVLDGPSCPDF